MPDPDSSPDARMHYARSYGQVVIFDFFLPLSQEGPLRAGLDGLFYRDVVEQRLGAIPPAALERVFGTLPGESREARLERACEWVSANFRGYSVMHVNGRFRAGALRTSEELLQEGNPAQSGYVADETTAMVRFVFPVGAAVETRYQPDEESILRLLERTEDDTLQTEADKARWMFYTLFVDPIVRMIEGEDEIWLLESGYVNRLHKWIRK